jgi:hypothetical protein
MYDRDDATPEYTNAAQVSKTQVFRIPPPLSPSSLDPCLRFHPKHEELYKSIQNRTMSSEDNKVEGSEPITIRVRDQVSQ